VPAEVTESIEAISDTTELDRLIDRVIDASSLDEVRIIGESLATLLTTGRLLSRDTLIARVARR